MAARQDVLRRDFRHDGRAESACADGGDLGHCVIAEALTRRYAKMVRTIAAIDSRAPCGTRVNTCMCPSPVREDSRKDARWRLRLSAPPLLRNFHHVPGRFFFGKQYASRRQISLVLLAL